MTRIPAALALLLVGERCQSPAPSAVAAPYPAPAVIAVPDMQEPPIRLAAPPQRIAFSLAPGIRGNGTSPGPSPSALPVLAGLGNGVAQYALLADQRHTIIKAGSRVAGSTVAGFESDGVRLADGRRLQFAALTTPVAAHPYEVPEIDPAPLASGDPPPVPVTGR